MVILRNLLTQQLGALLKWDPGVTDEKKRKWWHKKKVLDAEVIRTCAIFLYGIVI